MSKKFSAQRKRAFLTYLAQSGNQTLSAERAKVSRSWVQLHRSSDAGFDSACRAAIASFDRLKMSGDCKLWRGWGFVDGAELVVAGSNRRHAQVRRARVKQWSPRVETRFLSALAATCNVKAACAEVGMWPPSAYNHRDRWPAFAERWDKAIELGFFRIEAALIENGCNLFSEPEIEPDLRIEGMTLDGALEALRMHKYAVLGLGRKPGLMPRAASPEEIVKALKKRLASFRPPPPQR